ncbi:MAG: hypothetical protein LBE12_13575, partial [Planctomycetaceae bacterium]|nr:hypothetical protein [Planctomycetaceae bacterium]
ITSYVWGLRYIDDLVLREKGSERLYPLADPNWNVVAICNVSGDVLEHYTYNAFGKCNVFDADFTTKAGTELNWTRTFTGQVLDAETGLMLYRRRYYQVEFGRFISRDPIEYDTEDVNLMRICSNSTPNFNDSLGESKCTEGTAELRIIMKGRFVEVPSTLPVPVEVMNAIIQTCRSEFGHNVIEVTKHEPILECPEGQTLTIISDTYKGYRHLGGSAKSEKCKYDISAYVWYPSSPGKPGYYKFHVQKGTINIKIFPNRRYERVYERKYKCCCT